MAEIRIVKSSDVAKCRIRSLLPSHYKDGGGCKCPVRLVKDSISGLYTEEGTDATWTPDEYTEPRDTLFDCAACGQPIEDWNLWTCLDGGDAAHQGCVEVVGMTDDTAAVRREMIETGQSQKDLNAELYAAARRGDENDPTWTTAELQTEFDVLSFMAPFVTVRRKSDGKLGSLEFTHSPRIYFGWKEYTP